MCEESAYFPVTEGDAVPVRYLRRDPATNALHSGGANEAPPILIFMMMPLFILLIFAVLFWPSVRDVLGAKRLFQNGRLTAGHVVFIKKRSTAYFNGMPSMGAAEERYARGRYPLP